MNRSTRRPPQPTEPVAGQQTATRARERSKAAVAIGRQSLVLASRARAAGLTDLARLLETIALEAAAGAHTGEDA